MTRSAISAVPRVQQLAACVVPASGYEAVLPGLLLGTRHAGCAGSSADAGTAAIQPSAWPGQPPCDPSGLHSNESYGTPQLYHGGARAGAFTRATAMASGQMAPSLLRRPITFVSSCPPALRSFGALCPPTGSTDLIGGTGRDILIAAAPARRAPLHATLPLLRSLHTSPAPQLSASHQHQAQQQQQQTKQPQQPYDPQQDQVPSTSTASSSKPAADPVYNLPNAVSVARLVSGPLIGYWLVQGHYEAATLALAVSGVR